MTRHLHARYWPPSENRQVMPYEAVRGAELSSGHTEYIAAIDKIGQEAQGAARSFPGLKRNDVAELGRYAQAAAIRLRRRHRRYPRPARSGR